jgi:hypothetical protein
MKCQLSYAGVNDPEIMVSTKTFLGTLTANRELFEQLKQDLVSIEKLQAALERLETSYDGVQKGLPEFVATHKETRKDFNQVLSGLTGFVKLATGNDPGLLMKLGYQVQKTKPSTSSVLSACSNFTLHHGAEHGTLVGKCSAVKGAKSFLVEYCEGDPTIEANWKHATVAASCSKIVITGLTPGKVYSFRVRAVSGAGTGPWSSIVTLMVV